MSAFIVRLTAFVAKSFVAAANNDFLSLDPVALRASYAFIAAQQNPDGSFRSKGILHNKRLQVTSIPYWHEETFDWRNICSFFDWNISWENVNL